MSNPNGIKVGDVIMHGGRGLGRVLFVGEVGASCRWRDEVWNSPNVSMGLVSRMRPATEEERK